MEKDQYGRYIADSKNPMLVDTVTDQFGNELDSSEIKVLYVKDEDGDGVLNSTDNDPFVPANESVDGLVGGYPKGEGNFFIVVYTAEQWKTLQTTYGATASGVKWFDANGNLLDGQKWGTNKAASAKVQSFRVAEAESAKSLEGSFAFEVDSDELDSAAIADREDFADTTFKYLGEEDLNTVAEAETAHSGQGLETSTSIKVGIALDGKQLDEDTDYVVDWSCSNANITKMPVWNDTYGFYEIEDATPATYTATIYGEDDYAGSEATVTFAVDPIDLSKDVIAVETKADESAYDLDSLTASDFTVNGERLLGIDSLDIVVTKFESSTGQVFNMPEDSQIASNKKGVYTFRVAPEIGADNPFVVNGPATATGVVVDQVVNFYYGTAGTDAVADTLNGENFVTAEKQGFDPEKLSAYVGTGTSKKAEFTFKVTKDGKEVSSYTEAGTYVVTLDSAIAPGFASAGHEVATFTVIDREPVTLGDVFLQAEGKALDGNYYYTGQPYKITVAAYDDEKNFLTEGVDYTVEVQNSKGEKVDSIVDADTYKIFVTVTGAKQSQTETGTFTVSPAPIKSAKADQSIYAYTGEAIAPTFTGFVKDDLTGLSVALSAANAKVTYKTVADGVTYDATDDDFWTTAGNFEPITAEEVKAVGIYEATIQLPVGFENFTNNKTGNVTAVFKVAEQVAFTDVAADAWYAEAVYTAAKSVVDSDGVSQPGDFRYMTGIEGTKLFMPEALITRAEVAQVFFNMAGGVKDANKEYPTKFSDVDKAAWYAQAISWASTAGVVGGYEGTDVFGAFDNATREQVATMIYRYAKAQGMDVAVEDEAKALSAYADADQLTYGKTAMAWCVEQGIFGVDVDTLRPTDNLTRAEMAATSVRVQPDGRKQAL